MRRFNGNLAAMSSSIKMQRNSPHKEVISYVLKDFLPKWGHGASPLAVRGKTMFDNRRRHRQQLMQLGLTFVDRWELPDVVAYSKKKNWLFLIEAVHSSGPISPLRLLELKRLASDCTADIVFVTAFLSRDTFRKFAPDIAWETEVWIAAAPDHMVHFDGDKFLGPYKAK
jgi:type II restriction enzyme